MSTLTTEIMRKGYNVMLLDKLTRYLHENPHIRFGQALANLKILEYIPGPQPHTFLCKDPFYEEPDKMWERVKQVK